jgi:Phage tail assembly chaperone proteins, E, or 41 or 14
MSAPAPAPQNPAPQTETVILQDPILRANGEAIGELTLRKPKAGELRGLKVEELWATDINALFTLLPRIASPQLIPEYLDQISTEDLFSLAGTVKGFFMSQTMREHVARAFGAESKD